MASDLAGFWDMLQLSIENISLKFDELHQLRANNWRPLDPPERKVQTVSIFTGRKGPNNQHEERQGLRWTQTKSVQKHQLLKYC